MLSREEWSLIDNTSPGYVGKRRNELWAERDSKYGKGNWQTIWLVAADYLEYTEACRLYEDAYFENFKKRPELLEYLLEVASNVYDDDPSNVESGFDYSNRGDVRTHIQDIAIRNCVKRFGREFAVFARQRRDLETAKRGMRAAFAGDQMGARMGQNLVARPAIGQRRRDIAHGARGHEHGGFLAEQIGNAFAQQVHGRVVADLLVANLRLRHCLAHRRRRARLGVRQQVDADGHCLGIARGRGIGHHEFSSLKVCSL